MATRRGDDESRISQLPKPILQHILSFLPQKNAIRTCVLSKSWRHLGPTRPNVVLRKSDFSDGNEKKFMPVLDKILQTYQEQSLYIQDLHVEFHQPLDSKLFSVLEKSVRNMSTLRLACTYYWRYFILPPLIFQSESLKEIYLKKLKLNIDVKLLFKHLKTLHLIECCIEDETFVNILSSCPSIEYLVLHSCKGLKTIELSKAHNLKRFDCTVSCDGYAINRLTISVKNHFPHLKSLYLCYLRLSAESFDNLSSDNCFPCLEELELDSCVGFKKFVLSSRSIKRLKIKQMSCKGSIDAANILYFEVSNIGVTPPSISLTTTSQEWESQIETRPSDTYCFVDGGLEWFLKVNKLLKALSQSQVSFKPSYHNYLKDYGHFLGVEPAVVENLDLSSCQHHSFPSYPDILIYFFSICRPRYIKDMWSCVTAESSELCSSEDLSSSCKSKFIIKDRLGIWDPRWFWQDDLKEIRSEVWDHKAKQWHHVQLGTLSCPTRCALLDKHKIRYRLRWRGEKAD